MALVKSKLKDIPKDAVVLSEKEAIEHQMDIVKKWKKSSEVFALRYGPYILGTAALFNGAFLNNYFRRKFFLGAYGRLSTYFPICVVPGALSMFVHSESVLRNILLMKGNECPVCLELRAAVVQAGFGVAFPLIIGPLGCASVALRYGTYDVPYMFDKPKDVLSLFKKIYSRIQTKTMYFFVGQAFLGSAIAYFEATNFININRQLTTYDEELSG